MAEARTISVLVPVMTRKEEERIQLTLTKDEAQAIADLLYAVGGSPETTRRGLVDQVAEALSSVVVPRQPSKDIVGTIYFK